MGQVTLAFSMFAVVVALPKIMSAMSADVTSIHWIMTGFQIARTVPMPALGWLSSLVGNRTLYLVGLVTTVASIDLLRAGMESRIVDCLSRHPGDRRGPRAGHWYGDSVRNLPC